MWSPDPVGLGSWHLNLWRDLDCMSYVFMIPTKFLWVLKLYWWPQKRMRNESLWQLTLIVFQFKHKALILEKMKIFLQLRIHWKLWIKLIAHYTNILEEFHKPVPRLYCIIKMTMKKILKKKKSQLYSTHTWKLPRAFWKYSK